MSLLTSLLNPNGGGGGGTPGGPNNSVQVKLGTAFTGYAGLTFDGTTFQANGTTIASNGTLTASGVVTGAAGVGILSPNGLSFSTQQVSNLNIVTFGGTAVRWDFSAPVSAPTINLYSLASKTSLATDSSGNIIAGTTPGTNTRIIVNASGALTGYAGLTYDTSNLFTVNGNTIDTSGNTSIRGNLTLTSILNAPALATDAVGNIVAAALATPIASAAGFPTSAAVQVGQEFFATADVTDNDPTKTNTGQTFLSGQFFIWNGATYTITSYVATPPAGLTTQLQFNNGGAFGASANLTFDTATSRLALTGALRLVNGAFTNTISTNVVGSLILADSVGSTRIQILTSGPQFFGAGVFKNASTLRIENSAGNSYGQLANGGGSGVSNINFSNASLWNFVNPVTAANGLGITGGYSLSLFNADNSTSCTIVNTGGAGVSIMSLIDSLSVAQLEIIDGFVKLPTLAAGTATALVGADASNQLVSVDLTAFATGTRTFNNTPSHAIQTVAAAANGFQLSTTQDAIVAYSCNIITTASVGVDSSGSVVLEIAATNSTTAGDWIEINRITNGQVLSVAAVLTSVQTTAGCVSGTVPAGYYARLRSINNSGTPTYAFNSGQEVLI